MENPRELRMKIETARHTTATKRDWETYEIRLNFCDTHTETLKHNKMGNYGNCDWMPNKHVTEFSQWDVAKLQTIRDQAADSPKLNSNASSIRIKTASNEH